MSDIAIWGIAEFRDGERTILTARAYRSREAAEQAAKRMTNAWRTCTAIPLYEEPTGFSFTVNGGARMTVPAGCRHIDIDTFGKAQS